MLGVLKLQLETALLCLRMFAGFACGTCKASSGGSEAADPQPRGIWDSAMPGVLEDWRVWGFEASADPLWLAVRRIWGSSINEEI